MEDEKKREDGEPKKQFNTKPPGRIIRLKVHCNRELLNIDEANREMTANVCTMPLAAKINFKELKGVAEGET